MAKRDCNVVTSLCGKGLEREYLLLKDILNAHDVYVNVYHYTNYAGSNFVRADINIFLEVVMPNVFNLSRENWLFPNCEWWNAINDQFLSRFTKVCCKTMDCYRIWAGDGASTGKVGPYKAIYTGFEARDLYHPEIPRENRFLHLAGQSEFKNTEAVIEAWRTGGWNQKPFPLTLVTSQKKYQDLCEGVEGITCIPRASEDELVKLMNSHRFHILPSAYEGFGHALNEGIGCGALVITTAAPPMSEFDGIQADWLVPVSGYTVRALARLSQVPAWGVQAACSKAVEVSDRPVELENRSRAAREAFLKSREFFRQKLLSLVGVP